jgi:hypothetical protein
MCYKYVTFRFTKCLTVRNSEKTTCQAKTSLSTEGTERLIFCIVVCSYSLLVNFSPKYNNQIWEFIWSGVKSSIIDKGAFWPLTKSEEDVESEESDEPRTLRFSITSDWWKMMLMFSAFIGYASALQSLFRHANEVGVNIFSELWYCLHYTFS